MNSKLQHAGSSFPIEPGTPAFGSLGHRGSPKAAAFIFASFKGYLVPIRILSLQKLCTAFYFNGSCEEMSVLLLLVQPQKGRKVNSKGQLEWDLIPGQPRNHWLEGLVLQTDQRPSEAKRDSVPMRMPIITPLLPYGYCA